MTCATGEPVKPGGFDAAGLDATKSLVEVDVGHDAGADKVADRTCDFLQRIYIIHGERMPPVKA